MKKLILSIFTFLLTACSHQLNVTNYYPTDNSSPRLSGTLAVGNFSYQPASLGLVQANQFEKNGGKISISIAELVRNATGTELDRSGVKIDNGDMVLSGKIKEFSREYVHFPHLILNFKYLINYKITDRKNNVVLLDRDYFVLYHTNHDDYVYNPALYLSKIIYAGYEKFAQDNDVIQILKNK